MKAVLIGIARKITDPSRPLADRAQLCAWARATAWHEQIERLVAVMEQDRAFASRARN